MKKIYLTGIDGSGKSTVAYSLEKYYVSKRLKVKKKWMTYSPKLTLLVIKIFKFLLVRKHNKYDNYEKHIEVKKKKLNKLKFLLKIQFYLFLFEYVIETYIRFLFLIGKDVLILDRYFADYFIEQGILHESSPQEVLKKIRFYYNVFPSFDYLFYIKIPPETAMKRKNDIPSVSYLEERVEYYDYIMPRLGAHIIDGTESIDRILNYIKDKTEHL